jgi:uncharacterized protein
MKTNTEAVKKIVASCCLLLASFSFAEFDLGVSYYQAGDFKNAHKEFLEAAERGDYDAQQNLGVMYYKGESVEKDVITGYAWMALAAQIKTYQDKGTHRKIYEKMLDTNKKLADEKHKSLFDLYGDEALEKKITPEFIGKAANAEDAKPIKKVLPKYPEDMLMRGQSGFVDVTFTIDKTGNTRDHIAVYSQSDSFKKNALSALRKWRYKPTIINGQAVEIAGMRNRFNFEIEGAKYDLKKLDEQTNHMREKAKSGSDKDKIHFAYYLDALSSMIDDYNPKDNSNEWYLSAAKDGNATAGYFLGRNILYGNMCKPDNNQSYAWLLKAAKSGLSDAEYMLAIESFSGVHFEKNEQKGFYWLERAAKENSTARVRLAWILATYPDDKKRNPIQAVKLLETIEKNYIDKQGFYQAWAAVAAEQGDFKTAVKWQTKAKKDAKELELPLDSVNARLAAYAEKKPWREEI